MKKNLIFFIIIIALSCNTSREKYFNMLKGEWQSDKFILNGKDISEKTFIINFYNSNHFWILDSDDNKNNFITSKYEVLKESNILKMDIKCEDRNLNGNYNFSIDTIGEDAESYCLKLTLEADKNYIQAIRHKLKYSFPPEVSKSE